MAYVPLVRALRLRTTAGWAGYRALEYIPIPYGQVRYNPLQADDTRSRWVLADGSIDQLVSVEIDGDPIADLRIEVQPDPTGEPCTYLRTPDPVAEESTIVVEVIGRIDSVSGDAITNPADWLYDVLANVQGQPITRASLAKAEIITHY